MFYPEYLFYSVHLCLIITGTKQKYFPELHYTLKKLDYSILETRKEDIPTITLIHNPSFQFSNYPTDIDLALSGHTHGGQIRLPVVGPIGLIDNLLQKKYYQGLHTLDSGTKMLVTSGVGETGTRARLFNPPEIMLLTIK